MNGISVRAGSKVVIDGFEGKVWRKSGKDALIAWHTADPMVIRTSAGRELSAWAPAQTKLEWVPLDSDRLAKT